jgi:hypothetical protein
MSKMLRCFPKLFIISRYTPIRRYIAQRAPGLAAAIFIALSGCAGSSHRGDFTEYALAVGRPYPHELAIAQERVNRYLARLRSSQRAQLMQNEYLAVETTTIPASDVPGLQNRIAQGKIQAMGGSDTYNPMSVVTRFVMIFETKSGQPATDEGFVVVDTPFRGKVGIFGGYTALYIGTGK